MGVEGKGKSNVYQGSIELLGVHPALKFTFPLLDFNAGPVNPLVPQNERFIALIGADILSKCVFVYDGIGGTFTLEFPD